MAQNDSVRFRTSIGGYNKTDVNEYLTNASAGFRSVESSLKTVINRQQSELEAARQTMLQQSALLCEAETQKAQWKTNESALAEAKRLLDRKNAEIAELQQEIVRLKAESKMELPPQVQRENLTTKRMAGDILTEARAKAQAILQAAEKTAMAQQTAAKRACAGYTDTIKEITENCCDDVIGEMEEIRASLNQILLGIRSRYTDINHKIDYAKAEMDAVTKKKTDR